MEFEIEEVLDVDPHPERPDAGQVEVRARLADGRLACVTLPKGDGETYSAGVRAYIAVTTEQLSQGGWGGAIKSSGTLRVDRFQGTRERLGFQNAFREISFFRGLKAA